MRKGLWTLLRSYFHGFAVDSVNCDLCRVAHTHTLRLRSETHLKDWTPVGYLREIYICTVTDIYMYRYKTWNVTTGEYDWRGPCWSLRQHPMLGPGADPLSRGGRSRTPPRKDCRYFSGALPQMVDLGKSQRPHCSPEPWESWLIKEIVPKWP